MIHAMNFVVVLSFSKLTFLQWISNFVSFIFPCFSFGSIVWFETASLQMTKSHWGGVDVTHSVSRRRLFMIYLLWRQRRWVVVARESFPSDQATSRKFIPGTPFQSCIAAAERHRCWMLPNSINGQSRERSLFDDRNVERQRVVTSRRKLSVTKRSSG